MTLLQTPVAPSDHTHLRHWSCHPAMRLLQVAGFYEGAFLSDAEFWTTLIRLFICHSLQAWCYLLSMPTDWRKLSLLPTNMFLLNLWIILSLSKSWTGVKVCLTLTVVLQIPHWTNLHLLSSLYQSDDTHSGYYVTVRIRFCGLETIQVLNTLWQLFMVHRPQLHLCAYLSCLRCGVQAGQFVRWDLEILGQY